MNIFVVFLLSMIFKVLKSRLNSLVILLCLKNVYQGKVLIETDKCLQAKQTEIITIFNRVAKLTSFVFNSVPPKSHITLCDIE